MDVRKRGKGGEGRTKLWDGLGFGKMLRLLSGLMTILHVLWGRMLIKGNLLE